MRDRRVVAAVRRSRRAAARKRRVDDRADRQALAGYHQSQSGDRRGRAGHRRARSAVGRRAPAVPGQQRRRIPRGHAARLPLPRSAARAGARQHHAAQPCHRLDPPAHAGAGLHRVPDADPDRRLARGRARLPGAEPAASRHLLRAAAGAAAVQAAADGRRVRPLFPDRPVLPRRGRPGRPLARRVLPARFRDVVRDPGGCLRRDRAGAARRLRGIRARPRGDAGALSAHHLCRRGAQIRHRQARSAGTRSSSPTSPRRSAARASGFSPA